jgi:AcrR family transcriptional regulator
MARDSEDTRRRIFEAATAEFASHGIAGARIDRIAARAAANKQLIYAYFGNKRQLFEIVVSEHVARFIHEVPFDAYDMPTWAGRMYRFFVAEPHVSDLGLWHALEPEESQHRIPIIERAIRERTRQIAKAQSEGKVSAALPPAELLAVANAIARAWATAPPERTPRRGAGAAVLARRHAAVVEAVRRLVDVGLDDA